MVKIALLLLAAATASPANPADDLSAALKDLKAVVEDDVNPDSEFSGLKTEGCTTTFATADRSYAFDWGKVDMAGMSDGFLFVMQGDRHIAIVTDTENAAQMAKMMAADQAMLALAKQCGNPALVDQPPRK